ncbi:MAG: hypothetical protein SFV54_15395 [Bryobacteraceae bacterium]|nr:hypothetical protein [Bryobacteraceae bacterium]
MRQLILLALLASSALGQRFYPDDPLEKEPAPLTIHAAVARKLSDYYDFFTHQFGKPGEHQPKEGQPIPAQDVNTLGEPMDGAWYTKRHYYRRMSIQELKQGPGHAPPPAGSTWRVVGAKDEGITPGFTIADGERRQYFLKFDPVSQAEMATSAEVISSRFFHALGYHVPDNYIVYFRPEELSVDGQAEITGENGKRRKLTVRDVENILARAPRLKDGRYRATASAVIEGQPLGPPRYYGVRKDDPNDVVPHEHRRDLRGLHVFAAWLGHDDSRAINNFEALVEDGAGRYIRHYLLDLGSTLGSGTQRANSPRSGAYLFSWKSAAVQLVTLGLDPPYWARAKFREFPSVGLIEGDAFDPERWVPEYPNPAFLNRLPDDEFWAAKQVMAFTEDDIRAVVSTGEISDQAAAAYLVDCLIKRRDKIGKAYFAKVLPFDRFRIEDGALAWDDLSKSLTDTRVQWFRFDNETGKRTPAQGMPDEGYGVAEITAAPRPKQSILVYTQTVNGKTRVVGVARTWGDETS